MSLFHAIYGEGSGPTPPTPTDLEPVLLWTNDSPTTAFAAQTISLDLSEYAGVLVEFNSSTSVQVLATRCYAKKTDDFVQYYGCGSLENSAYQAGVGRHFGITETGVEFGQAYLHTSDNNTVMIPTKIYGIKEYVVEPVGAIKEVSFDYTNTVGSQVIDLAQYGITKVQSVFYTFQGSPYGYGSLINGEKYITRGVSAEGLTDITDNSITFSWSSSVAWKFRVIGE